MVGLITTNLTRRLSRTLLTAMGVGMGVATIVALIALTQGLKETAAGLIHLGNSDLGVFQAGVSDPTASVLPASFVARLRQSKQIEDATPLQLIVEGINKDPAAVVFGADPHGFFTRSLVLLEGEPAAAGELMVGDRLAERLRLRVGQTLSVKGHSYRIAGVYHSGIYFEDAGAVMSLADAQVLSGRAGEETSVAVRLAPATRAGAAASEIKRRFPGTQVISDADQAARAGANNVLIHNAIIVIIVVALIVGAIGVTNTMVMSVLERQGELALLSTVGWSATRVALMVIGEGVGVSILGAGFGLLLGVLGSQGLVDAMGVGSYVSPSVTAWGLGQGLIVGIAIGVLGGIYPAWRVTRMNPLKGLSHA